MLRLAVLAALSCILLACSGDEAPPTSATPPAQLTPETVPTAQTTVAPVTGIPRVPPAEGPVLLYRDGGGFETLIAYDLGAGEELWRYDEPGPLRAAVIAGRRIVLATDGAVTVYEIDGGRVAELLTLVSQQEWVNYMAASPDGRLLAVTLTRMLGPTPTPLPIGVAGEGRPPDEVILVFDIEQQREVRRFDLGQPEFEGFKATFGPLQWLPDGSGFFLWGATGSERPGNNATLYLDGRVVRHDSESYVYVAPDSRMLAEGFGSLACLFISGHDVTLRDLGDGRVVAVLHDETRAFTGFDWSPDSAEFLVESRAYAGSTSCEDRWWDAEPQLLLLDARSGAVSEVTDLEALMRRWYGDDLLWLDCAGEFVPPRPHPFGNGKTLRCDQPATLHVRGEAIAVGGIVQVLGIIE